MAYDDKNMQNAEITYEILNTILSSGQGDYSSNIANDLDISQQLVSEIISLLYAKNILEKGERTKAQYYKISEESKQNVKILLDSKKQFDLAKDALFNQE